MKRGLNLIDWVVVSLLIVFSLYQVRAVFVGYWFTSHDGIFHLMRAEEFFKMIKAGFFPVRWGLDLDNGYGVPIFNYVYPGPYYLTSFLQMLGMGSRLAVKLLFVAAYGLGGVGFYQVLKDKGRLVAGVGSLVYLLLPYHFLDIFVRGALGEVVVMGLAPWVWGSAEKLTTRKLRWYDPLPLFLSLLSHNFLSLILLVLLVGYLLVTRKFGWGHVKLVMLALGMAAFFLLPMVLERKLVTSGERNVYTFNYRDHFVGIQQLWYGKWDYWYSVAGKGDGMSFQLGFASILLCFLGIVAVIWTKFQKHALNFWVFIYISCVFLMTEYSSWVWKTIWLLQPLQFPWRFLAVTTLITPLIWQEVAVVGKKIGLVVGVVLVGLAFYNSRNYKRPLLAKDQNGLAQMRAIYSGGTTTASRYEVAPRWSVHNPYKTSDLELVSGTAQVEEVKKVAKGLNFTLNSEEGSRFRVNFNYFPSWKLSCIDCRGEVRITPGLDGEIDFEARPGRHSYALRLGSTPIEWLSNGLSMLAVLALVKMVVRRPVGATS